MITNPFQNLFGRLAVVLFFSFLFVKVLSISLFVHSSRNYQQEIAQIMHRQLAEHVSTHYLLFENGKPNLQAAKDTFHDLMILGPNFEFYVLDKAGGIIAYSTDPANIKRTSVDLAPINNFIETEKFIKPIYGNDPRSETKQKIFSASPIRKDGELLGYMYIIIGSEIYDSIADVIADSKIIQWGLLLLVMGFVFSLVAALLFTGIITRPLRLLTRQINQIQARGFASNELNSADSSGELARWNKHSANEIDVLGSAFRELLEKLGEQYNNVITVDQLRKELLSHVSHDLRTPLASLLGYLETWEINREKLTDEQSAQYINTAKKSAQKISNLVEQLFELAHLDSGNVQVTVEKFSIAELVQDVLQKFKIIAEDQRITLSVSPQDSHIMVVGDIEKLDRVFTNLIDNAIRHTKAGGSITVRLAANARAVAVEVSDTGIGIPSEDIPHVFEPHYKAGNSIRGNTAHGGLGLAITKKLLDLHQSTIKVKSRVNQGTTFQFMLPASV